MSPRSPFPGRSADTFTEYYGRARKMKTTGWLWLLWLLLIAVLALSASVNRLPAPGLVVLRVLPWVVVGLFVAALASWWPEGTRSGLSLFGGIVLLFEAAKGIFQVLGWEASRHAAFSLTGSFDNPGPYGGFIAATASLVLARMIRHRPAGRALRILFGAALFLGLCVLPATLSRTAWLALLCGAFAALCTSSAWSRISGWMHRHTGCALLLAAAALLLGTGAWFLKRDSAMGRLHIWGIECLSILEHPFPGAGPGLEMGAYGMAQEHFYEHREITNAAVEVAGCPEYAFNEYLRLGMQGGVGAMLLAGGLLVLTLMKLFKTAPELACGLTSWSVFAFASYPLSVPLHCCFAAVCFGFALAGEGRTGRMTTTVLACLMLLAWLAGLPRARAVRSAGRAWKEASQLGRWGDYESLTAALEPLYPSLKDRFRYLYDLGYGFHREGRYAASDSILTEGLRYSSDPMFLNIMGKNAEARGLVGDAEALYLRSIHRVPCRLYPRLLLSRLYLRAGRPDAALETARAALALPVHPRHALMQDLHVQLEAVADSARTDAKQDEP